MGGGYKMECPSCTGEAVSIKMQTTCIRLGIKMRTETKTTTLSLIFVIYFHGIFHSTVASIPILNADLIKYNKVQWNLDFSSLQGKQKLV